MAPGTGQKAGGDREPGRTPGMIARETRPVRFRQEVSPGQGAPAGFVEVRGVQGTGVPVITSAVPFSKKPQGIS